MSTSAAKRKKNTQPCSAVASLAEQGAAALPDVVVDEVRLQTYAEKLRRGKSFLNLVLN